VLRKGVAAWVFLSALLIAPLLRAQESVEGSVVGLDSDDIVVDLAGDRGAETGDLVEIWRPLRLKHPVTGKVITDRFKIGTLRLTQVRDKLSLARPDGKLSRTPQAGDVVLMPKAVPVAPAAPTAVAPKAAEKQLDPEASEVSVLFDSLRGQSVARRVMAYEAYVRKDPNARYSAVLWEEAQHLRKLLLLESGTKNAILGPELLHFEGPTEALAGTPLVLGVEIAGHASGAVLHARRGGEIAFVPTPMRSIGVGYYSVTIAPERMRAPVVEYFIEAIRTDGTSTALVASAEAPERVEVNRIPTPTPALFGEGSVSILTDFADYNRMRGNDWTWQTEGQIGMRFQDEGLRALRTGFGVYRGVGGSLEELDEQGKSGRRVGLTYGYLETEYAFTNTAALVVRGIVGLRDDGIAGGAQALVRIGSDKETNLMLGGEVLGGIGLRGITQLELNTFERVPILLRTEVTNQPAGSSSDLDDVRPADEDALPENTSLGRTDVGARAIVQIGYRLMPGFVVAARGSYQGRTINHAGPGFGGAVTYTW
jgi:hypothetical protein